MTEVKITSRGEVKKLSCVQCGTIFNCGSTEDRSCWCMNLPNMHQHFDLAGSCLCPDCLTKGKAKQITKQRKQRNAQRTLERERLRGSSG